MLDENLRNSNRNNAVPDNWDRKGLPGWTYHSPALLELEKRDLFKNHWQIVCHISDIPNTGDYLTMDFCGERALVIRGEGDSVKAFRNMCRHRGSRLVANEKGTCKGALVCPFHGWVYNLDGTLRGAAQPRSFPDLDKVEFGLQPVEMEVWNGLIFIRFNPGPQPSVAELLAPFAAEVGLYRMPEMVPVYDEIYSQTSPVNWKSVRDVDNEGYHVAMAHPALQDLYGQTYYDEPLIDGINRSVGIVNPSGGRRWSVRNYTKATQAPDFLPESYRKAWIYWGLFPNAVIAVTPETMQFYHEFPVSVDQTQLRGQVYRYKDESREQRAARYLAMRIDRDTLAEDVQLTIWSNESMKSEAFQGFFLSDLEYGVKTHHDAVRAQLPVTLLAQAPAEEDMDATNTKLKQG